MIKGKAFRTVLLYLGKYRAGLVAGGICLVVTNVLLLANPWILKITIDSLKGGMTKDRLFLLAGSLVIVTAVSGVFRFLMRRIIIGISRKIEFDLRQDFFSHLQGLSPSFYARNRTGDLMALATNDLNAVRALVGPGVMYSMNTIVVSILAVSLMAILTWKLTLIALLPMIFLSAAVYHSVRVIHRLFEKVQEKFAGLNSRSQENLSGIRVVKAYAREEHEIETFRRLSLSYVKQNMKLFKVQSFLMPLLTMVAGLGALIILAYGGSQVIGGDLSLGSFVAFHGYLTMLIWPMIALGWVMNVTQRGLASMERINRIMRAEPEIKDPAETIGEAEIPEDFSIEFRDVSFTYPAASERVPALRSVSFHVREGETIAITGPTGAGKTSLISLLLRLYQPTAGSILMGGVPIEKVNLAELRRLIGLVPQDIFLFSTSLRDNIAFGVQSMSNEALEKISGISAIRDEIEDFPRRYDTLVGERGINLSGGQKQRVAIARALAKNPRILILDDALSSVDAHTEEKIISGLKTELEKRTSIIVSHRISAIRDADRIMVMDVGSIVEEGSHETLLERGGMYAEIYRKQAIRADLDRTL